MVSSITEFVSYFEAGEDMTDEEYGTYMRAVHNFAFRDIEPDYSKLTPLVKAALRTVIASVRKNKEDRLNSEKAVEARWGKKKTDTGVSEKDYTGVSEKTDTGVCEKSDTKEKENEKKNEKENENTHISACEEPLSFLKPEKISVETAETLEKIRFLETKRGKIPDEPEKPVGQLQQDAYAMLSEHNRTAEKTKKVPISGNFFSFCCKEMRELYSTIGTDIPTDRIRSALENFLKVARSDTWRKTFTWRSFCTHFNEFTPEFFDIQRYLTDWKDNGDVSTRPDNVFFHAHKNDPRFKWRLFRDHKDEWEAEGRPDGEDYYRLQDSWEALNDAS